MEDEIPRFGLTVVVNPENPRVDIVFVHGFNDHPQKTWSTSAKKSAKKAHTIFWPRDLIPETIPDTRARVLTYGHGACTGFSSFRNTSKLDTFDSSNDFLVALGAERRQDPDRPIVFIAHSYGDLIVKEAVRQASVAKEEHPHSHVYKSTAGFIFIGTPHSGVDNRWLNGMKMIACPTASFKPNVAAALHPESERAKQLRVEFGPMARDNGWLVHSFLEQIPVPGLGKVVEDTSARIDDTSIEVIEHILQDHRGMCRFTSNTDPEYKKVAHALNRIVSRALDNPKSTKQTGDEQLKKSVYFSEVGYRESTIKAPHKNTCEWFLQTPEFINWRDPEKMEEHHGFLWIRGKPGAGKSTLMNYLLEKERESMSEGAIVHFFFHSRGTALQKCTVGMYRSLLFQLFEVCPKLLSAIKLSTHIQNNLSLEKNANWHIEELQSPFQQALLHAGQASVVCFIDALDECDEDEIRDTLDFWEQLSKTAMEMKIQFRLCASSRHYPVITTASGLSVTLDYESGHNANIVLYVNNQLKPGIIEESYQIKDAIQRKASGVFLSS